MQDGNAKPLIIEKIKERTSDLVKALNLIYKQKITDKNSDKSFAINNAGRSETCPYAPFTLSISLNNISM